MTWINTYIQTYKCSPLSTNIKETYFSGLVITFYGYAKFSNNNNNEYLYEKAGNTRDDVVLMLP